MTNRATVGSRASRPHRAAGAQSDDDLVNEVSRSALIAGGRPAILCVTAGGDARDPMTLEFACQYQNTDQDESGSGNALDPKQRQVSS